MARQVPLTCPGHTRPVVDLAFSGLTEEGSFLISASKDGFPMLRAGDTGDWIGTFEGHKGAVWGATLNNNSSRAATGAADFTAKLWDPSTGEMLASFSHRHIVKAVAFTKDSRRLVTGCQDKKVYLFDCERPDDSGQQLKQHSTMVKRVCCDCDGNLVFSSSEDRCLSVWDLRSGNEVHHVPTTNAVTSLELSRDSTLLIATHDRVVSLFDVRTIQPVKEFAMPSKMYSASLHPNKSSLVAGGEDFQLYKFDFVTGEQLESYKGHFGPVHAVRYSPDGEVYASGSEDGTLRLWQNTVGKTYGLWVAVSASQKQKQEESSSSVGTVAAASS